MTRVTCVYTLLQADVVACELMKPVLSLIDTPCCPVTCRGWAETGSPTGMVLRCSPRTAQFPAVWDGLDTIPGPRFHFQFISHQTGDSLHFLDLGDNFRTLIGSLITSCEVLAFTCRTPVWNLREKNRWQRGEDSVASMMLQLLQKKQASLISRKHCVFLQRTMKKNIAARKVKDALFSFSCFIYNAKRVWQVISSIACSLW